MDPQAEIAQRGNEIWEIADWCLPGQAGGLAFGPHMETLVATLCDSAVENQGKLNVIGAFDAIVAQSFPAGFSFTLALRLCFTAADHGTHKFSIRLGEEGVADDGSNPEESEMTVQMPPGTPGFSTRNLITPLHGSIKKAGIYRFDVRYDGAVLARVPMRVIAQSDLTPQPGA